MENNVRQICSNCGLEINADHIFCRNCGTPIPKMVDIALCSRCGLPVSQGQPLCASCQQQTASGVDDATLRSIDEINAKIDNRNKRNKVKKRIRNISIISILAVVLAVACVIVWMNTGQRLIDKQLLSAEVYVEGKNYQGAIDIYETVLEKDPKNITAYLGIADSYIGLDRIGSAIDILDEGYKKTNSDEMAAKLKQQKLYLNENGNTAGNIVNLGLVAQQGNRIYSWLGGNLVKSDLDGNNRVIIANEDVRYINVVGDWVYYCVYTGEYTGEICKICTDGTQRTKLSDDCASDLIVVGEWLYYLYKSDSSTMMFKIRNNGTGKKRICNDSSMFFNVAGGWIYYSNASDENKIYKIKTDGTKRTKISNDQGLYLNVIGNWIYYCNWSDNGKLYKILTNGENRTKISDDVGNYINVVGDWIYYCNIPNSHRYNTPYNVNDYGPICKIRINGSDKTKVSLFFNNSADLNIVGDWIYFLNETNQLNKMHTDGTEKQLVSIDKE